MGIFVNFSNHPTANWSQVQIDAAKKYGELVDISFPALSANLDENDIKRIGDEYVNKILSYDPSMVMCQGEFTLTYYVINRLREKNVSCVSACTERVSKEMTSDSGEVYKESVFMFKRFRKYI